MSTSTDTAAPPEYLHPDDKAAVDAIVKMTSAGGRTTLPQERLALLADFIGHRTDAWKDAHAKTVHASITLLRSGTRPADIYKQVKVTRSLFNTWTRQAPADLPPFPGDAAVAVGVHGAERRRHLAAIEYARALRDDAIREVLDGDDPLSNAEIGRLAGLTGQRITQMRTGVS